MRYKKKLVKTCVLIFDGDAGKQIVMKWLMDIFEIKLKLMCHVLKSCKKMS